MFDGDRDIGKSPGYRAFVAGLPNEFQNSHSSWVYVMKAMAKSPDNLSVLLDISIDRGNDDTLIHVSPLEAAIDVI